MESIQAITKLKQEEDAAKIVNGSEEIRSESRTLSRRQGTSGVPLFNDADGIGSEESRTLSHGRGMSEVSENPDPSQYSHRRDHGSTI